MKCHCPECGNEQTQKVSAIIASGTSSTTAVAFVDGIDRRNLSWLEGNKGSFLSLNSTSRTHLASRFSPPPRAGGAASYGCCVSVLSFFISFLILWGLSQRWVASGRVEEPSNAFKIFLTVSFIFGVVVLPIIVGVYVAIQNYRYNKNILPKLQEEWNRLWYCHRCDTTFTIS